MSRTRTRWRLGLTATALLVASAVVPGPAHAADVTDYAITVDPKGSGAKIDDTMYGVFFEDINHAADGGLYAELVQNRSFEYGTADNRSYTPLTSWATTGTATTVDDDGRLNARNRTYLALGAGSSVTNSGYNTGIRVERQDVRLLGLGPRGREDAAHRDPARRRRRARRGPAGHRARRLGQVPGQVHRHPRQHHRAPHRRRRRPVALDMISLIPRDTYKGHGLRKDLAEKIAALHPGFVRFPGGCLVNTGSMQGYDEASGYQRRRSYQWKDTIGPVEQRATNSNFWGYNQSYGLGYYEYFQFAEDIGAMPLPVVPALVTGCGQNQATDDDALLKRHIQDTLDLIEFANGPVTSEWGRKRAAMGHPKPFHLTHLEVGNEENLPDEFFARFKQFRAAVQAKYPNIKVISNAGPDDSGTTFDTAWKLNKEANVDMVDEHYYNSTQWFLQNNDRYDSYDRNGPKVFLGEYASGGNTFKNALAEAAYMTGLERNADVVKLASYAPLLANEDYVQWRPDMIWFNNHASWGSADYEVQKLFMNNVGDRVVPSTATTTPSLSAPISGAVGLSTWATTAAYDDVLVTGADGTTLLSDDFSGDASRWTHTGGGSWSLQDGQYVQTDVGAENTMVSAGDPAWHDYDLHVKATKKSGKEGFLVAFGVKDTGNYYWWNLGGWNNTTTAVEQAVDGGKSTLISKPGTIETGKAYDVDIKVRGRQVTLYLDGQGGELQGRQARGAVPSGRHAGREDRRPDRQGRQRAGGGRPYRDRPGRGEGGQQGRRHHPPGGAGGGELGGGDRGRPVKSTFDGVADKFTYTFPANSVTFLRIRQR